MKKDKTEKKTIKKPVKKKTDTKAKTRKKSVDKTTSKTKVKVTKESVKKQPAKKKTDTKTKATKKSADKVASKTKVKTTKKSVKKQETKKPISKTKTKATKSTVKKVSKKTVKKTDEIVDNKVDELIEEKQTVYDPIDLDVLSSVIVEKESKERKLKITVIVCAVLFVLLVGCVFALFNNKKPQSNSVENNNKEVITENFIDSKYKDIWNEYHDNSYVSDDYVGQIVFESGVINEPVMQGETNDTYLNRNYKTYKYEVCGPVFMDFACKKDDQNLVLYGHTRSKAVDPNRVMMFTPLHLLEDKNNYEENKTIYFVYEDYVDVYLVCSVYSLQTITGDDGLQYLKEGEPLYYLNSYSDSEFKEYIKAVKQRQLYDTGIEITSEDKLLTLQTCLEGSTDKFIVLAKKIETRKYK